MTAADQHDLTWLEALAEAASPGEWGNHANSLYDSTGEGLAHFQSTRPGEDLRPAHNAKLASLARHLLPLAKALEAYGAVQEHYRECDYCYGADLRQDKQDRRCNVYANLHGSAQVLRLKALDDLDRAGKALGLEGEAKEE